MTLTSLPYIMRWCVVIRALKTTTQLWFAVLSNNVSAKWGIFTFSSLVQCIRSADGEQNRAETMTVHDPGPLYCGWKSLWTYLLVEYCSKVWGQKKLIILFNKDWIKGIVHPKIKILSSFTHPDVVPNLYEFHSSAEHKKEDILKNVGK